MSELEHDDVIAFVDGQLEGAARAAFERRIANESALREAVRRARIVRELVAGLPRRSAGHLDFDTIIERTSVDESASVPRLFAALPRHRAPESIFNAVLMRLRADRRRRVATAVVRAMPFARSVARVAAAAVLMFGAFALVESAPRARPARNADSPRFAFSLQRVVPGAVGANGAVYTWPPAFLAGVPTGAGPKSNSGGGK